MAMQYDIHAFDNRAFTITTPDAAHPEQGYLTLDDGQSFPIVGAVRGAGNRYDLDPVGKGNAADFITGPVIGAELDAFEAAAKPLASPIVGAPRDEHGNPTTAAAAATSGETTGVTAGATSGATEAQPADHASKLLDLVAKVREDASLADHWFVNHVEKIAHELRAL